jgi:hypothetical protein
MSAWYIKTRREFHEVLARTREVAVRRGAGSPLPMHDSIVAQLDAMGDWTANGRTPTPEERDRITIGLYAIREMDPPMDDAEADHAECLVQLAGYFEEWPDDPPQP